MRSPSSPAGRVWIISVSALLAVAVLLHYSPETTHVDDASAQAAEDIQSVTTMSYTLTLIHKEGDLPLGDFHFFYRYPDILREGSAEAPLYSISDHSKGTTTVINHDTETYQFISLAENSSIQDINEFHRRLANLPGHHDEYLGEEMLDGEKTQKYEATIQNHLVTFWTGADGKTARIQYHDLEPEESTTPSYAILTNISINPDLPDALFDMTPPQGYSLLE